MSELEKVKIKGSSASFDEQDFDIYSQEYRKKPVVIRALRLEIPVVIQTLEGEMTGDVGDWLIEGVKGEFYPCKDDIFRRSYERAGK